MKYKIVNNNNRGYASNEYLKSEMKNNLLYNFIIIHDNIKR
jgi:hypothetical protein